MMSNVWGRRGEGCSKGGAERGEETLRDTTESTKVQAKEGLSRGSGQGRRAKREEKEVGRWETEGISNKPGTRISSSCVFGRGGSFLHRARCLLTTELAT